METKKLICRSATAALLLTAVTLASSVHASSAQSSVTGKRAAYSYGWPVKPFDRPHPVRGNFGDPRTLFHGPPTRRTLLAGGGAFQFHFGVDISAPDGTAVYPVMSGTVESVSKSWIRVASSGGPSFQYWHIVSKVSLGQHVERNVTVLGHIRRGAGHVHLTELDGGHAVNPLAPGHLGPYADKTAPVISSASFRTSVTGNDLMPEMLRGRVEIVVGSRDMPSLRVPGCWRDLPVTPALLEWRIERAETGTVVVPTQVAFDVREHVPPNASFWLVYARGSHQNMSVFGKHYSYMQPGAFLFRLTPGGFDTRQLRDDVYDLVVTATDIRGNHTSTKVRFSVHNNPGVVGP